MAAACGPGPSSGARSGKNALPKPITQPDSETQAVEDGVIDALGRRLSFREPPRRIVLPGRAVFIIADAIYMFPEAGKRIAATGRSDQGASKFFSLIDPDTGARRILAELSGAEQIAEVRPDVVFLKSYLAPTLGNPLEALGIPVVYVDFETPDQYFRDLQTLGRVLGQRMRAAELIAYYRGLMERVRSGLEGLKEDQKRRALLLQYSEKGGMVAFRVPPGSWMQTQMTVLAGGIPVWKQANPGRGWATVALEQILAWDPDDIFMISYTKNSAEVVDALRSHPIWNQLSAMKAGKVHAFAGDLYSWDQPSPRWILGLLWMARQLYPDRFVQVDIPAVTEDFYRAAYGLDSEFFRTKIRSTFQGDLR